MSWLPRAPRTPAGASGSGTAVTVYTAGQRGLPPLAPYLRQVWHRRAFALRLARTGLEANHLDTLLGRAWTVLNPLLLAAVYLLLITVLRGGRLDPDAFAVLVLGLFVFSFTRYAALMGARSVLDGSDLVLNTAFPRALLPGAAVLTALAALLPTLLVYVPIHLAMRQPVGAGLLLVPVLLGILTVLNLGLALLLAAVTVSFRDTIGFLPYCLRIWLYLTPVLYRTQDIPSALRPWLRLNPLYALFDQLQAAVFGGTATAAGVAVAAGWALAVLVLGAVVFLLREREFGVRL